MASYHSAGLASGPFRPDEGRVDGPRILGIGTNPPCQSAGIARADTSPYGKGRVFTTVMGHAMGVDTTAIRCVGFRTTMLRGAEWAATGKVTIPIPEDFPTASQPRVAGAKE
jgi:hypothetical protein